MLSVRPDSVLHIGDCREVLLDYPDNCIDAVVTDPPYELGFMGKKWDATGVANDPETWRAILRVMKPGAHLLAFGGTRTYHRMACGIEDAGFEIRDSIHWIYGTGFPKSLNLGDGRGTALKPAHEPIVLARKPCVGTATANINKWRTGGLNVEGCRIPGVKPQVTQGVNSRPSSFQIARTRQISGDPMEGRWPANVIFDETLAASFLESRFFYCAKASRSERDLGCSTLPSKTASEVTGGRKVGSDGLKSPRAGAGRTSGGQNHHPTVKPLALMRWLVRLVTPPNGLILDPFVGSGTTGMAAQAEGFAFIGIDMDAEYLALAEARIAAVEVA